MAKCKANRNEAALLGFEDEPISDKHETLVGYWTNKIGGLADFPIDRVSSPQCELCALPQLLVVQIYAPIENSPYHRTLYIFCCINPNCWNLSQSWTCRRCEVLDEKNQSSQPTRLSPKPEWCSGADDWDDDNGNAIQSINSNVTDSDDSSSVSTALGALRVDQCNANWGAEKSGAVGKTTASASAEIEGDEGEVITIDTPTAPQRDLIALLEATAPLPSISSYVFFAPSFIWVSEEGKRSPESDHVRSLLSDYQSRHGDVQRVSNAAATNVGAGEDDEKYERGLPSHGDPMVHDFVMRIQENPGQILRYCRGSAPLLMAPLEAPRSCRHCQGPLVFELQLLPTLLNKLQIPGDSETHVDFGNVVIFSCQKSCWSSADTFKDEVVCVQVETATGHSR